MTKFNQGTLTKEQAIEAMSKGEKVTHVYFFADNEHMTLFSKNVLIFEDGVMCSLTEFFSTRLDNQGWGDGYLIVKEIEKKPECKHDWHIFFNKQYRKCNLCGAECTM